MRRFFAFLAVITLATFGFGQTTPVNIGSSAVWQPSSAFLPSAHAACDKVSPSLKFAQCVIDQMPKAGASADAVSFTRELYKEMAGEVGIMTGFQARWTGRHCLGNVSSALNLRIAAGQRSAANHQC